MTATESDRVRIVDDPGHFEVTIRAPCDGRIFWAALLLVWTFVAFSAATGADASPTTLVLAASVWLIVSGLIAALWCWAMFGRETLTVRGNIIAISRGVGKFRLTRSLPLEDCSPPRVSGWYGTPFSASAAPWLPLFSGGNIVVGCRGRTARFGIALGETQAQLVAGELASRMRADIEQAFRADAVS